MNKAEMFQLLESLVRFSSTTRLYELTVGDDEATGLLVEAFTAEDAVQEIGHHTVIVKPSRR